jgi:hypothetical protein
MTTMTETSPETLDRDMPHEVDQLRATIAHQLRDAGVHLSAERLDRIAEIVLTEAVSLALGWIEGE